VSYLVDTNVISELQKRERCDAHVARWFEACRSEEIFLSVLAIGEIRRGIESIRLRDHEAASALDGWLQRVLADHLDHILPVDQATADEWGRLNLPDHLPVIDGLLAATAKIRGMTLVTRNTKDVERTGVSCLNPFDPPHE
jgi:predicted nucleic acid-binding protein